MGVRGDQGSGEESSPEQRGEEPEAEGGGASEGKPELREGSTLRKMVCSFPQFLPQQLPPRRENRTSCAGTRW